MKGKNMSWIEVIADKDATGRLKALYDKIRSSDGSLDHIMMAHSLRPHTMEAHMKIYKYVLYHSGNKIPSWFLESLGSYVSSLNGCTYCTAHHFGAIFTQLKDNNRSLSICGAISADDPSHAFDGKELEAMKYARALTLEQRSVNEGHVQRLREAGYSDGEILEINQVVSYFGYANRMVMGIGVSTRGETVGLAPSDSDNPDDWGHV